MDTSPEPSGQPHRSGQGSITYHPLMPTPAQGLIVAEADAATIERLQRSFRTIAPQGEQLVVSFYTRLFERYPGVRSMFPADMASQQAKLLGALATVIEGLAAPDNVRTALRAMGLRHAGYGARPEHYPLVCDCLVDSMREVAGAAWSDEVESEWKRALELISRIMLDGASAPSPGDRSGSSSGGSGGGAEGQPRSPTSLDRTGLGHGHRRE